MKYLAFAAFIALPAGLLSQAPKTLASTAGVQKIRSERPPVSSSASASSAMVSKAAVAPVIDGTLEDPAWQAAQSINTFLEYDPNQGAESRFKTDVRVVYDEKYLYVMARMYDPSPDSIISLLSRRDVRTQSEQLKL
ncbi:MAG: sugar-binding protein, partial [Gemmatimonadaceae bacterium]